MPHIPKNYLFPKNHQTELNNYIEAALRNHQFRSAWDALESMLSHGFQVWVLGGERRERNESESFSYYLNYSYKHILRPTFLYVFIISTLQHLPDEKSLQIQRPQKLQTPHQGRQIHRFPLPNENSQPCTTPRWEFELFF